MIVADPLHIHVFEKQGRVFAVAPGMTKTAPNIKFQWAQDGRVGRGCPAYLLPGFTF